MDKRLFVSLLGGRTFRMGVVLSANVLAVANAVAATPEAQVAGPGAEISALVKLVIGLLAVLVMILVLARYLRRVGSFGYGGSGQQLRIITAVAVGQKERVVLLQAGKTQLLIGVAPGRVQTLHVLDEPMESADSGSVDGFKRNVQGSPFAKRLRRLMQQQQEKY